MLHSLRRGGVAQAAAVNRAAWPLMAGSNGGLPRAAAVALAVASSPSPSAVLSAASSSPNLRASLQICRSFSSKSPKKRVQLHPHQAKVHAAAAAAAAEAFANAARRGESGAEAVRDAAVAAGEATHEVAPEPSHKSGTADEDSATITLPSKLLSSEQPSRRAAPQGPSSFDSAGRANLRTKLHPDGAIVGRGRVVANFGTRLLVQELPWNEEAAAAAEAAAASSSDRSKTTDDASTPTEGVRFIALPRGKLGKMVCGDVVLWEWSSNHADSSAFIVEVLPRATEFRRVDKAGAIPSTATGGATVRGGYGAAREEVLLASNFDHMCIVCAAAPATNATLLDRYLAAARRMGVGASIIFNKQDLPQARQFDDLFEDYERIGVKVFRTSCKEGAIQGIEPLREHLASVGKGGKPGITIFVGQSGSGKSSLLNSLSPSLQLAVNDLSRNLQGRHTTTQTILHALDAPGGEIIDSPGFQNYQPPAQNAKEVAQGFQEMDEIKTLCHFGARCLHINEPGCAVRLCVRGGANEAAEASLPRNVAPEHDTGLTTEAKDAPHGFMAHAAVEGATLPRVSPEAQFFQAFQEERARQLRLGINLDADAEDTGATMDPTDRADNALGEQRNKEVSNKAARKEKQMDKKQQAAREIAELARQNAHARMQAEAVAMAAGGGGGEGGEGGEGGSDEMLAALEGNIDAAASSHVAQRARTLASTLAQKGLLDSISPRRYQSYLQLVSQQRDMEKNRYT